MFIVLCGTTFICLFMYYMFGWALIDKRYPLSGNPKNKVQIFSPIHYYCVLTCRWTSSEGRVQTCTRCVMNLMLCSQVKLLVHDQCILVHINCVLHVDTCIISIMCPQLHVAPITLDSFDLYIVTVLTLPLIHQAIVALLLYTCSLLHIPLMLGSTVLISWVINYS